MNHALVIYTHKIRFLSGKDTFFTAWVIETGLLIPARSIKGNERKISVFTIELSARVFSLCQTFFFGIDFSGSFCNFKGQSNGRRKLSRICEIDLLRSPHSFILMYKNVPWRSNSTPLPPNFLRSKSKFYALMYPVTPLIINFLFQPMT